MQKDFLIKYRKLKPSVITTGNLEGRNNEQWEHGGSREDQVFNCNAVGRHCEKLTQKNPQNNNLESRHFSGIFWENEKEKCESNRPPATLRRKHHQPMRRINNPFDKLAYGVGVLQNTQTLAENLKGTVNPKIIIFFQVPPLIFYSRPQ